MSSLQVETIFYSSLYYWHLNFYLELMKVSQYFELLIACFNELIVILFNNYMLSAYYVTGSVVLATVGTVR